MSQMITLQLPDSIINQAKAIADRTDRRLEDVLVEWIQRMMADQPVESLSDEEILALCSLELNAAQQADLSELLARNREGQLSQAEREALDHLMTIYREGMVRRAKALKIAVERGLRPPLG